MQKLKMLTKFSISKKINNKIFLIVNTLFALIIIGIFFLDIILLAFLPNFYNQQKIIINDLALYDYLKVNDQNFEYIYNDVPNYEAYLNEGAILIQKTNEYNITTENAINDIYVVYLQSIINEYENLQVLTNLPPIYQLQFQIPPINFHVLNENTKSTDSIGFMIVTFVYFVALSFASSIANEVVYEKSTRMMELILTSISPLTHLLSKLFSGWIVLLFQISLFILNGIGAFFLRYIFDKGKGLLKLIGYFGLFDTSKLANFDSILAESQKHGKVFLDLSIALVFMFLGILIIQSILVIISSFISNIEESGNIQSPFYIAFMSIYYLTLFLNTPQHMIDGIGRVLSMVPIFSMLFMPCRIFYYDISYVDILISGSISLCFLVFVVSAGSLLYKKGVLDYSSRNLIEKIKR